MALDSLSVQVDMTREESPGQPTRSRFATEIRARGRLTERERQILINSARRCEVRRLLQGEVTFEEKWSEGEIT